MLEITLIGGLLALALGLPLAWKWELGVARAAVALAVLAVISGGLVALTGADGLLGGAFTAALTLALATALVLWRFFRDPERTAPEGEDIVVSPAEGQVIYVKRSADGQVPVSEKLGHSYRLDELVRTPLDVGEAIIVGIALSFLDVHVNRAPVGARVVAQRRFPGPFRSLKDPSAVFVNERSTTLLEHRGTQLAVVLIASRLVRRIISFVKEGDDVAIGQRIGAIRFGSQVDLVLPAHGDVEVLVTPGQRVRAGETVVARLSPPKP
ncbi:phosphatidylserine decarboxylase [Geodermatophilus ruber]|uniref:Phosphatidylserine decarboxylase n=1 Tax=Geodermatophilus ruber TaxID=504800 RepID=A0A1I4LC01_9ACTN|nr:phosphatidylserine decarboxylase [Geodermatophilus ruber]SFL88461.1 phosphatidylserine decarboxylase [Geodermatophilus ruber]